MADKMVKLYASWRSPFSNRLEIALKMKGVEYELIVEDLLNKSPELLRYNPVHKKIPVLVHGTKAIAESQIILEYIDETWDSGTPILPRDPYERAQARFWARFIDEKVLILGRKKIEQGLILGEEKAMEEAIENMKILDKELEGKRFFGGESIGFVDIVANAIGYWLGVFEEAADKVLLTVDVFPSVYKWRDEFLNCEVIQQSLPTPRGKLVDTFRDRVNSFKGQTSQ